MRKKNSAERIRTVCFFPDYSEISVEGSDTETAVNMISEAGIALRNIRITDEMTVQMTVRTADLGKVREILKQRYRVEVLRSAGYFPLIRRLLCRKGLIAGVCCFIAVIVFQQSFVAEMRIEGNTGIPEEEMSAVLRENGLFVGCSKSSVDEAKIRNSLYASFPELTWVGIEIRGAPVSYTHLDVYKRQALQIRRITSTGSTVRVLTSVRSVFPKLRRTVLSTYPD